MAGYENLDDLLLKEIQQKEEEGCEFDSKKFIDMINNNNDIKSLYNIYKNLNEIEVSEKFPYYEPSMLEKINQEKPGMQFELDKKILKSELLDKVNGAWLGRSIGCALGKPLETSDFMFGPGQKENVKKYLQGADAYPLDYYVPESSTAKGLEVQKSVSTREKIKYMESDDDIRYTLLGLEVIDRKGIDFKTKDMAEVWMDKLPINQLYTAELQAYLNLVNTEGTPRRGVFDEVNWLENAVYLNPYREWIGAQIRADFFGYIVPGKPELAAELAWRDARMSHVKNGIYGEMFFAAIIAAAFFENKPEKLLKIGLSQIPKNCRLAVAIKEIISLSKKHETWESCFEEMINNYGKYSAVHTINNALIVAISLLYGKGDFEKTITIAVMSGYDTDCNGATAGSILGIINGANNIPEKWKNPLNDTIDSEVIGYGRIKITEIASKTVDLILLNNPNIQ
ncbi:MAG: ADP-ribosylglycohydrolase family protein [Halanaerobiales bacterium]